MIKKLRWKFIAVAMLSLSLVLLVVLGCINWMGYQKVVSDADDILALLSANQGDFPPEEPPRNQPGDHPQSMSPETPYESRFFSILLDETGQPLQADLGRIAAVDQETALDYAAQVLASGRTAGFFGEYRFLRCEEAGGTRIIFLDCSRGLSGARTTLLSSLLVTLGGLSAVFFLLVILSKRIIRPVIESYEKQRRFITDAGHELKTPLTTIGADADLLELECGDNEWLTDIRRQTQRLTGLTEDLIYLSRMEEEHPRLQPIEFPLSDVAEEMAHSFQALAKRQGKELEVQIQPMLSFTGDEKALGQMCSILLDNALKYSPEGGHISFQLSRQGRTIRLAVTNTTAQPVDRGQLEHFFDRFYRGDPARNSKTSGYGLGLSIARGIVQAHRGKIWAEAPDDGAISILVSLTA